MKNSHTATIVLLFLILLVSCNKSEKLELNEVVQSKTDVDLQEDHSEENEPTPIIITKDDELIIITRTDYPPFSYENENGEITGYFPDCERLIYDKMGYKYRFVVTKDVGQSLHEVKTGEVHAIMGLTKQPIYEVYKLTDHYFTMLAYVFVREEEASIDGTTVPELIESLKSKTVGVQTRAADLDMVRNMPEVKYIEYATGTDALVALADKEVDAKIELAEVVYDLMKKRGYKFKTAGPPLMSISSNTGFAPGMDQSIVDQYNAAMQELAALGEFDRIYSEYFR